MEIALPSRMRFILPLCLILVQIWTPKSFSAEEVTLRHLLYTEYEFGSGFRFKHECPDSLISPESRALRRLSRPISEFRNLPLKAKLREVHDAADVLFRASQAGTAAKPSYVSDAFTDPQISSALGARLKVLAGVSSEKMSENTRELLVICNKLLPLSAFAGRHNQELSKILRQTMTRAGALVPARTEEKVDHDLRAALLGNLAAMSASLMGQAARPALFLQDSTSNIVGAIQESRLGHRTGFVTEAAMTVVECGVLYADRFPTYDWPHLDQLLFNYVQMIAPTLPQIIERAKVSGNLARVNLFAAQLQRIISQPNLKNLPKLEDYFFRVTQGVRWPER